MEMASRTFSIFTKKNKKKGIRINRHPYTCQKKNKTDQDGMISGLFVRTVRTTIFFMSSLPVASGIDRTLFIV